MDFKTNRYISLPATEKNLKLYLIEAGVPEGELDKIDLRAYADPTISIKEALPSLVEAYPELAQYIVPQKDEEKYLREEYNYLLNIITNAFDELDEDEKVDILYRAMVIKGNKVLKRDLEEEGIYDEVKPYFQKALDMFIRKEKKPLIQEKVVSKQIKTKEPPKLKIKSQSTLDKHIKVEKNTQIPYDAILNKISSLSEKIYSLERRLTRVEKIVDMLSTKFKEYEKKLAEEIDIDDLIEEIFDIAMLINNVKPVPEPDTTNIKELYVKNPLQAIIYFPDEAREIMKKKSRRALERLKTQLEDLYIALTIKNPSKKAINLIHRFYGKEAEFQPYTAEIPVYNKYYGFVGTISEGRLTASPEAIEDTYLRMFLSLGYTPEQIEKAKEEVMKKYPYLISNPMEFWDTVLAILQQMK